jgi:hypothetical protein
MEKSFDNFPDAFGLRVGHFKVDLGELRLAIGAKVFVAEAADDLKIFVEAGDHQDLFEHLRGLREGVKSAGLHAARDKVIACAFGRGAGHEGSFDFEEALVGEVIADGFGDFVAGLNVELHDVAAKIDVAIFQAGFFVGERGVGGQEGRELGFVEDAQLFGDQFYFAGGHVFVDGVRVAELDHAGDGDDVLVAQGTGFFVDGAIAFGIEDDLRYAGAVAEIDEQQVAVVAAAVDPSHEDGFFTGVGGAQSTAHVSSS